MNGFEWVPVLYFLGAAQGLALSFALLGTKGIRRGANRYLGALIALFTITLIAYLSDYIGFTSQHPWILTILWPKEFFFGVLIYFYVREMCLSQPIPLEGRQWLHFLPAAVHVIASWSLLFLEEERQLQILSGQAEARDTWLALLFGNIELVLSIVAVLIYLVLSLSKLSEHRQRIKENFSYTEKLNLDWLRAFIVGLLLIYAIWVVGVFNPYELLNDIMDAALGISMVLLVYGLGYMGLRQPYIFRISGVALSNDTPAVENSEPLNGPSTINEGVSLNLPEGGEAFSATKYRTSSLSPELSGLLVDELDQRMASEKLYLYSQISLPMLAEKLGVSVNYLSQSINERKGVNFFDYINGWRIQESVKRLDADQSGTTTILDVAMASGFNSKSAFYTAFKKHQGMTPGQYRKQSV